MNRLFGGLLVLLGSASYGMLSTITKLAYRDGFSTAAVVGGQMLFGCLGFWLAGSARWKTAFSLSPKTIIILMLSGSVSGLTGIFYYLSLQTLTASYAVVIFFQFTWMGMLLDWLGRKQPPTIYKLISLLLILAGTFLSAGYETWKSPETMNTGGVFLALLAALCYTLFINFNCHVATEVSPLVRNMWMIAGAVIITFIVFPPRFIIDGSLLNGLHIWGGFLGFFGIIIPFYLFARGVPLIGTGMASLLGAIELPVVILCSSLVLSERFNFIQWSGVLMILAGIFISVHRGNPAATA